MVGDFLFLDRVGVEETEQASMSLLYASFMVSSNHYDSKLSPFFILPPNKPTPLISRLPFFKLANHFTFPLQYFTHMIQEQPAQPFRFLLGEYARIKIKMQPKSLTLQVPLEWQINKIKCLLVKMIPRLEFDMFVFTHDDEQLPGDRLLKSVIEADNDQECINGEYYVLTFRKANHKEPQFQRYYSQKMSKLIGQLERSPFQPILHPGYYKMKRANQLSQDGKTQAMAKIQHIQQIQNVLQEQRRQVENQGAGVGWIGWAGNLLNDGNNQGRGVLHWVGVVLIRVIQLLSLVTILRYVAYNADINSFIILAVVLIAYFLIDYLKKYNRKQRGIQQSNQAEAKPKIEVEEVSFVEKMAYWALIVVVERSCLVAEFFVAYILSLFPNWTVDSHKDWFQDTCKSIDKTLAVWNLKITPIPHAPQQPESESSQNLSQPVAEQNPQPDLQKQHEQ